MNILPFGFPMGGATGAGATLQPPAGFDFGFAVALDGVFAGAAPVIADGTMPPLAGTAGNTFSIVSLPAGQLPANQTASGAVPVETSNLRPLPMSMAQLLTTATPISTPQTPVAAPGEASPQSAVQSPTETLFHGKPVAAEKSIVAVADMTAAATSQPETIPPAPEAPQANTGRAKGRVASEPELPAKDLEVQPGEADLAAVPTAAAAPAMAVAASPIAIAMQPPSAAAAAVEPAPAPAPAPGQRKTASRTGPAADGQAPALAGTTSQADARFGDVMAKLGNDGQNGSGNGADTGQHPAATPIEKPAGAPTAQPLFQHASAIDPLRQASPQAPAPAVAHEAEIAARPGHLGHALGVEIASKIQSGEETLRVRLNPAELGRVEVTLAFDDRGSLQATMRTESAQALDLLRQDVPDLARTLDQAGVRTDAQSFRFESRAGDGGGQNAPHQQQRGNQQHAAAEQGDFETDDQPYRAIRSDGRVDLLA